MNDSINKMSLATPERIISIVKEAENELKKIQPEIDYLEQCKNKLDELKDQQFKLNSLILSLKSIVSINNVGLNETLNIGGNAPLCQKNDVHVDVNMPSCDVKKRRKIFLPDQAITQVKNFLRTKNNLNYEIFKSIVFNSGVATTAEIKKYLIENNIKQPKSGKSFENVELKEISSRANYLVRKNILESQEQGVFRSILGWDDIT